MDMTPDEFENKLDVYQKELDKLFDDGDRLENEIKTSLRGVKYVEN